MLYVVINNFLKGFLNAGIRLRANETKINVALWVYEARKGLYLTLHLVRYAVQLC